MVPEGTLLIEADSPGAGLFVIDEGRVRVEQRGQRRAELGPGTVVGEMALLRRDGLRTARVRALTDVRCFALDRRTFQRVLVEEPRLALSLLETLAERVWD
jgi:CRP-like cAMP-binding protein